MLQVLSLTDHLRPNPNKTCPTSAAGPMGCLLHAPGSSSPEVSSRLRVSLHYSMDLLISTSAILLVQNPGEGMGQGMELGSWYMLVLCHSGQDREDYSL